MIAIRPPGDIAARSLPSTVPTAFLHARGLDVILADQVDAPAFGGGHRGDEFAPPCRRVEDALRPAHPAVHVAGYLAPDRLPARLIDIAEPARL
jgi:hypothetical protein